MNKLKQTAILKIALTGVERKKKWNKIDPKQENGISETKKEIRNDFYWDDISTYDTIRWTWMEFVNP